MDIHFNRNLRDLQLAAESRKDENAALGVDSTEASREEKVKAVHGSIAQRRVHNEGMIKKNLNGGWKAPIPFSGTLGFSFLCLYLLTILWNKFFF
jgi:hypothetical protein